MTKIEWTHRPGTTGESWNMIGGCTKVQPECANCYALRDSWRIMHNPKHPSRYNGVAGMMDGELRWTGRINLDWDALEKPRHWAKPRTVFVASMADVLHRDVPDEFVDAVFDTIEDTPQHTYLMLTKRSERMLQYWQQRQKESADPSTGLDAWQWPRNCWAGVSAGTRRTLAHHLTNLAQLQGPPVKFVSAEPLLERLNIEQELQRCPLCGETPNAVDGEARWRRSWDWWEHHHGYPIGYVATDPAFNWLLIGGETGKRAREMQPGWARDLLRDCRALGVPAFVKQLGQVWAQFGTSGGGFVGTSGYASVKGADPHYWPEDLQVREWPR